MCCDGWSGLPFTSDAGSEFSATARTGPTLRWHKRKESACQCRRCKRLGIPSWVGKNPWRREWVPTPVFLPGNPMDSGAWQAIVYGVAKSQTRPQLSMHTHTHTHTHTPRSKTITSLEEVQSNRHLLATYSTHELAILVTTSKAGMERQRRLGKAFHSLSGIFLIPHCTVVRTDEKKIGVSASHRWQTISDASR